jgi:xanthine dehydrogenase YagS FAD-binding subunit
MKEGIHAPKRVINIKGIRELDGIRKTRSGVRIGSIVTLDELIENPLIRAEYPALRTAAQGVASLQVRNLGTVGGDLCQRPRCWYFRNGYGILATDNAGRSLARDGDNRYHAIFGNQGPACFVSASSLGPPLVALGATLRLVSSAGARNVEAAKFFVVPARPDEREVTLQPNEILTDIIIPHRTSVNATYEVRQKESLDWPLASASVALTLKSRSITAARVVLGHVAPIPWIATKAEELLRGQIFTADTVEKASWAAVSEASPLRHNAYKVRLARVAVKRALLAAAGTG